MAFEGLDEVVKHQSVPVGTPLEELILPETLSATAQTGDENPEPVTVQDVTWEPDALYEGAEGSYDFTASAAGYACAEGVDWPVITVTVEETTPVPDEIDALCAAIDALPTVEELSDNAPGNADPEYDAWVTKTRAMLESVPALWEQFLVLSEDAAAMVRITDARASKLMGLNDLAVRLKEMATMEAHTHCVCGGSVTTGGHGSHGSETYTEWTSTNSLPDTAGNYYLTNNVSLNAPWKVPTGEVNLCLGGKTVTGSYIKEVVSNKYACVEIPSGAALTICDCGSGGGMRLTPNGNLYGHTCGIYGGAGSAFTLYGGSVAVSRTEQAEIVALYNDGGTFAVHSGNISATHDSSGKYKTPNAAGIRTAGTTTLWGGSLEAKVTNSEITGNGTNGAYGARVEETGVLYLAGEPSFSVSNNVNDKNKAAIYATNDQIYAHAENTPFRGDSVSIEVNATIARDGGVVVREVGDGNRGKFSVTNPSEGLALAEITDVDKTHLALMGAYKVEFDANGGAGTMEKQEFTGYTDSKPLTQNIFTKESSTFTGWNTKSDGTGTPYADGATVSALAYGGTVTLYAQWEEIMPKPSAYITTGSGTIYANGAPLLLEAGTVEGNTVIYIDKDRNGRVTEGSDPIVSFHVNGVNNSTKEGNDLSKYTIYGGSGWNSNNDQNSDYAGDTSITMLGGKVSAIYGGSEGIGDKGTVTGNTSVTVSGGTVGAVYGGGNKEGGNNVDGNTAVTITGNAMVGRAYGGGNGNGAITGDSRLTISRGKVGAGSQLDLIYGGGNGPVEGTASVEISDGEVKAMVFGGGYTGAAASSSVTVTGGKVTGALYGGGFEAATTGAASVTMTGGTLRSGSFAQADGRIYGGNFSSAAGSQSVTVGGAPTLEGVVFGGPKGVSSVAINPALEDGSSVSLILPAGYDASDNPAIATGAVEGDLEKIKLAGSGAEGKETYFEDNSIKIRKKVPHTHAMSVDCSTTEGEQVNFDKTMTAETITINASGNYYLAEDVNLGTNCLTVTGTGTVVNLCLNGHTLTAGNDYSIVLRVEKGAELNLCDCRPRAVNNTQITDPTTNQPVTVTGGLITGGKKSTAGGSEATIYVAGASTTSSSTLRMYGGTVAGNVTENNTVFMSPGSFELHGGRLAYNTSNSCISINPGDHVEISGGAIENNYLTSQNGYTVAHGGESLTLSGQPVIKDNKIPNGSSVGIRLFSNKIITIGEGFATQPTIGVVTGIAPTESTPVAITGENSTDYSRFFFSHNDDYVIQNGANNVVQLALPSTDATLSALAYKVGNGSETDVPGFTAETESYNVTLPYGTAQDAVITLTGTRNDSNAAITANEGVTLSGGSGIAAIEVTAADGSTTKTYTVSFTTAVDTRSNAKEITAFTIAGQAGDTVIDQTNHTINVTMPNGTDVTSLTPTITVSGKASVSPASDTAQDFTDSVTYTVTAENETTQEYFVTVTVQPPSATAPTITTAALPGGVVGTQYSQTLAANGDAPIAWSIERGDLPGGLALDSSTGTISGTPMAANTFTFTVKAENQGGSDTKELSIQITAPEPTVTGVSVTPDAVEVQKGGTQQFQAFVTGANGPDQTVSWSLEGSHANGTSISNTGLLTVASNEAQANLTVKATSTVDNSKSGTATVTVTNVAPSPTYGVSLSQTGVYPFAGATAGYGEQTPLTVTVANSGSQPTGALAVGLSGSNAGSFTLSGTTMDSIAADGSDTFTVKPNTGLAAGIYTAIVTVTGGNGISGRFTVSFTVAAAPVATHTITASAGTGGTISPSGAVTVNEGENKTFTITPNSNYRISQVMADDKDQGAVAAYTFENVTANHSISVTFRYIGESSGGSSGGDSGSSSGGGSPSSEGSSSAPSTTTSTTARENGTSTTTIQTTSKDSSGKTTTVTTEITKDAAGNTTRSATTVTTDNITASTDQGSSTVTVKPDAAAIGGAAKAAGASETNPMDISVEVPQDTVKNELQKADVSTVHVEVVIPKAVEDNPAVRTAGVTVEKETVEAARQAGKNVIVTVREETGAVKAVWSLDGQAMGNTAGQSTDLNLGVHTAPIQSGDPIAAPVKPPVTAAGQENGLVISLTVDGTLLSAAKLTVPATNQTAITAGSTVALYRFDPNTGVLSAVPGGVYSVDANGNVTIDVPAGTRTGEKETYVLLPVPSAAQPAADAGGGAVHTVTR